jgi:hypothetical protein
MRGQTPDPGRREDAPDGSQGVHPMKTYAQQPSGIQAEVGAEGPPALLQLMRATSEESVQLTAGTASGKLGKGSIAGGSKDGKKDKVMHYRV